MVTDADASVLAFSTYRPGFVGGDLWVADLEAGTLHRMADFAPKAPGLSDSYASISADGRYVVWGRSGHDGGILRCDRVADAIEAVSVDLSGANVGGAYPEISADGNTLVWNAGRSAAITQLGPFGSFALKDISTGAITAIAPVPEPNTYFLAGPRQIGLSGDGSRVRYYGWDPATYTYDPAPWASNFTPAPSLRLIDRATGTNLRLDLAWNGDLPNGTGAKAWLTDSGDQAMFWSSSTNLLPAGPQVGLGYRTFVRQFGVIERDDAAPVVTGTVDRAPNANGWYRAPVTVTWTAVDPAPSSGAPNTPPPSTVSTSGVGQIVRSAQSCDQRGNCATGSVTVSIDQSSPLLTLRAPA